VIVPIRDQITQWTARIAERNPAIHTARALSRDRLLHDGQLELSVIFEALANGSFGWVDPFNFKKSSDFSHDCSLST
jgi:hypothetical protein